MNSRSKLTGLAFATFLWVGPATAQTMHGAASITHAPKSSSTLLVVANDLDLDSDAGRETLLKRLQTASRRFCQRDTIRTLHAACVESVQAEALNTAPIRIRRALVAVTRSPAPTRVAAR